MLQKILIERVVPPQPRNSREVIICDAEGCDSHTREGKPFCPEHVLSRSPYAQKVCAINELRERQINLSLRSPASIRPNFEVCKDLVSYYTVSDGNQSLAKVARQLHINYRVALNHALALEKHGVIKLIPTGPKSAPFVELLNG